MKRVLLISALLPLSLNAADDNADYNTGNIHPLEFTACGSPEQMHLLELAANRLLMEEEKLHTLNSSKKNECDRHSPSAAEIEERARESIEKIEKK